MVDGEIPQRVKQDAHAIILEFIRSRPPLRKVNTRADPRTKKTHTNKNPTGVREEAWSCPGQSAEPSRAADGEHQTGAPPATLAQPHQTLQPGALRHR